MSNPNTIYGKVRNDYMLNAEEVAFVNNLSKRFTKQSQLKPNNPLNILKNENFVNLTNVNISNQLKKILNKISSLSFIQENIHQIFNGYDLKNSKSLQRLYNQFNFKAMIENPNVLNQYIFENQISAENKKLFSNKSYIKNESNNRSKLGKSVLLFFFILQKMVSYIKNKKADFNRLIKSGRTNNLSTVNQEKLNQAIKSYKGFEYLMNKFLKLREKIFLITQLNKKKIIKNEE